MTKTKLIEALRELRSRLANGGATALYLYGSRARDDHRAQSDVDLFIDYDEQRPFSLFDLAGIKVLVEDALGIECHVTTRNSLHPTLRADIEREAVRVF